MIIEIGIIRPKKLHFFQIFTKKREIDPSPCPQADLLDKRSG